LHIEIHFDIIIEVYIAGLLTKRILYAHISKLVTFNTIYLGAGRDERQHLY
jgi:hypothetical protein